MVLMFAPIYYNGYIKLYYYIFIPTVVDERNHIIIILKAIFQATW